jgi:hypothetical protein
VPATNDDVRINAACSEALPVQFAGGNGFAARIDLGTATNDAGYIEILDGVLTNASTSLEVNIGNAGTGWLRQTNGSFYVANNLNVGNGASSRGTCLVAGGTMRVGKVTYIGRSGTGTVVQTGGTISAPFNNSVFIGSASGSSGTLIVSNGVFGVSGQGYNIYVGDGGRGELDVCGGTVYMSRHMYIANGSSSFGTVRHESGTLSVGYDLHVARTGQGVMVVQAPVTCRELGIGLFSGGRGYLEVGSVAMTLGANAATVVGDQGSGVLVLKGGSIAGTGNSADLIVRNNAAGYGLFRGWGTHGSSRQINNNGLIIADGEGVETNLNLTTLDGYSTTEAWANSIENSSTNGWYAVNKGRLMLANKSVAVTNLPSSYNWGEPQGDAQIDLVNSLRLTFASIAGTSPYFRFYLLASDRTSDLPPMPSNRRIIGAWEGFFSGTSFGTLGLEFRYDHVAAAGRVPNIYRYNTATAAWDPVATTVLSDYRLSVSGLTAQGTAKIGLFAAAVSPTTGTTILVR